MTHFMYFIGIVAAIVTYLVGSYHFWYKKDNVYDPAEAIFLVLCTTVCIVLATICCIFIWQVTK